MTANKWIIELLIQRLIHWFIQNDWIIEEWSDDFWTMCKYTVLTISAIERYAEILRVVHQYAVLNLAAVFMIGLLNHWLAFCSKMLNRSRTLCWSVVQLLLKQSKIVYFDNIVSKLYVTVMRSGSWMASGVCRCEGRPAGSNLPLSLRPMAGQKWGRRANHEGTGMCQ